MHTLLWTKMLKLHSYMFRTLNWFIFRESHNFTNHTHIQQYDHTIWQQLCKVHQLCCQNVDKISLIWGALTSLDIYEVVIRMHCNIMWDRVWYVRWATSLLLAPLWPRFICVPSPPLRRRCYVICTLVMCMLEYCYVTLIYNIIVFLIILFRYNTLFTYKVKTFC
jgi:hypothetical protein